MARGHEEASTNHVGRRRGTPKEKPTARSLVAAMSAEELRLYNQIPTEISLETSDGEATTTVKEAENVVYFTWGAFFYWASPPRSIVGEVAPSFHSGTSCTHTSKHFSDFYGLQCDEPSLPVGYLAGGDMFHLYFEFGDWGPLVHVGPQSPTSICNRAP